jgi:ribosomal protein L7/L12
MKAAREALGSELAEAKSAIADLPKEVLVDVEHAYAEKAAAILREAGCDVEVVIPHHGR